ncbi:hypothetical protein ACAX43_26500 [Paraburkholderia sp. IW21]|uniref:hypothetical protein n=1 Tax=Paraburkholderia sp. IW21 TaxID=3242488 RepID=UPI0035205E77
MTYPDEHQADATAVNLTIRTAAGRLRIIPVWQALGAHAVQARRTRVHCSRRHNFDEMTVTFESVPVEELAEIATRLNAQPWVVTASLHTPVVKESTPDVRG